MIFSTIVFKNMVFKNLVRQQRFSTSTSMSALAHQLEEKSLSRTNWVGSQCYPEWCAELPHAQTRPPDNDLVDTKALFERPCTLSGIRLGLFGKPFAAARYLATFSFNTPPPFFWAFRFDVHSDFQVHFLFTPFFFRASYELISAFHIFFGDKNEPIGQ